MHLKTKRGLGIFEIRCHKKFGVDVPLTLHRHFLFKVQEKKKKAQTFRWTVCKVNRLRQNSSIKLNSQFCENVQGIPDKQFSHTLQICVRSFQT